MGVKWQGRKSKHVINSPRWRALRIVALRRDDFRCVKCGAVGRLEVDHIEPVKDAPEKAFDLDNLQTLCRSCHALKTAVEVGLASPVALGSTRTEWRALTRQPLRDTPPAKQERNFEC